MMHVLRKFTAAIMAVSILLVTAVPTVSAAMCALPDMDGMSKQMQAESVTPLIGGLDCYIECGCRIDNHIDGMPHQLAPHALSMDSFDVAPAINKPIIIATPAFISRLIAFSPPPPRFI